MRNNLFKEGESMKTLKYKFISLLIVLLVIFLIKNRLTLDNGIDVVIFMNNSKDMVIQAYYTDDVGKNANEDESVKKISVGSKSDKFKKVKLNLPTKLIKKLRIDFDTFPGEFLVQKIEIKGKKKVIIKPEDINRAFFSEMGVNEKTEEYIFLDGTGPDPFMVLIEENVLKVEKAIKSWINDKTYSKDDVKLVLKHSREVYKVNKEVAWMIEEMFTSLYQKYEDFLQSQK